jgi:hypothetical protein
MHHHTNPVIDDSPLDDEHVVRGFCIQKTPPSE